MLFSSIGPRFTASHIFQFHLAMAFWSMPLHSHQFPLQHSWNAHWKKKNDVTKIQSCHICCIRSFFSWMKHFASFYFVAFFSSSIYLMFTIWLHNFQNFWLIPYLCSCFAKVKSIKIIIKSICMHFVVAYLKLLSI